MLVKFGIKGKEVNEFYVEDDSYIDDLVNILDVTWDDDSIMHVSSYSSTSQVIESEDWSDEYLQEGATYILENITLTPQEEKVIEFLEGTHVENMSLIGQRRFIKELIDLVNKQNWD